MVDPALHPHTVGVGVAFQSRGTATGGLVVGGVTLSVGGTRVVSNTGVKTVSVSTNLCDGTLGVRGTANWYTADLWIASESLRTEADRLVVVDVALGVGPAVAGVHAVSVKAGQCLQAVIVGLTADYYDRFRFYTGDPWVSNVT